MVEKHVEIETLIEMTDEQIDALPAKEKERLLAEIAEIEEAEASAYDQWESTGF